MIEYLTLSRFARSHIQPVSRVWFELSDTDAFDKCIQLALSWMSEDPNGTGHQRSGIALPNQAWNGLSFDITDEIGANPAKAARLSASDGNLWAARLDWPDPRQPRTWISEFFVEKITGRMTRFGAQVTCVKRGDSGPFDVTRPNVVRKVLSELAAEADGRALSDRIEASGVRDIPELIDLIYSPYRRLPVLVITDDNEGRTHISPNNLAKRIAGSSHIAHLNADASLELKKIIGKRMSAFNGAIRLYEPGLTESNEDPFAHPLWLAAVKTEGVLVRQIANRTLQAGFLDRSEYSFPRYSTVRDAQRREEEKLAGYGPLPLRTELDQARKLAAEQAEERDEWHSLALEEQERRIQAEREVERLKAEVARLESKAISLEYKIANDSSEYEEAKPERSLESYDDLEEWAEEVLQESVYIHQAALKDCRKNGHDSMLRRIESALLIMRDYMTPSRAKNAPEMRALAREKLSEIGVEDSHCFVNREEAKKNPKYIVNYEGEQRVLYDHLKYGNGYNNANQFRIYYFWDEVKRCHVVGKMPSHLPNNRTN